MRNNPCILSTTSSYIYRYTRGKAMGLEMPEGVTETSAVISSVASNASRPGSTLPVSASVTPTESLLTAFTSVANAAVPSRVEMTQLSVVSVAGLDFRLVSGSVDNGEFASYET